MSDHYVTLSPNIRIEPLSKPPSRPAVPNPAGDWLSLYQRMVARDALSSTIRQLTNLLDVPWAPYTPDDVDWLLRQLEIGWCS